MAIQTAEDILNSGLLWPHQVEAVRNSRLYIASATDEGALNRLPTGTGKSGIITVLARCYDDCKDVLVLVPSQTLREQLAADIKYDFFDRIGLSGQPFDKPVETFLPSDLAAVLRKSQAPTVFVGTIQALDAVRKMDDGGKLFDELAKRVDLVIFDEGHREPAPEWAIAVRQIPKPRILFTATPYRNDRLSFQISDEYIYSFNHADAVAGNYIRDIEFRQLPAACLQTKAFADTMADFYKNELPKIKPANVAVPRIIIRCADFTRILEICGHFADLGLAVIGIHERFDTALVDANQKQNQTLRKSVPDLKSERKAALANGGQQAAQLFDDSLPLVWVHQFKLLEGLDEFSFCVVADYAPMANARMMIQQAGRILRNRGLQPGNKGFVFYQQGAPDEKFWQGYLKYEQNYNDTTAMNSLYFGELYEQVSSVMPPYHYEDRDFKTLFDAQWLPGPATEDENEAPEAAPAASYYGHFNYRLSCQIFQNDDSLSLDALEAALKKELLQNEYNLRTGSAERPDADTLVFPFVRTVPSPVLLDQYFLNFHPGYVLLRKTPNYLFYYNSAGGASEVLQSGYALLAPDQLRSLFPDGKTSLRSITLRSTDIGRHIIRRQQVSAAALEDTVADMVDYLNFYSTATGKSGISALHQAQTYVGFTRSRISDQTSRPITYEQFSDWLGELEALLDSATAGAKFFDRYADYSPAPKDPNPVNILIDFDEIVGNFTHKVAGDDLKYDLSCCAIKNHFFQLSLETTDTKNASTTIFTKYDIGITYEKSRKKYILDCDPLKAAYLYSDPDGVIKSRVSLISYLNREQCFRIVPKTTGIIYAHNHFYQPRLAILDPSRNASLDLFTIFISDPGFRSRTSEKGAVCTATGWEKNSLFELVDNLGAGTRLHPELKTLDYLVCDDSGNNEVADFIGLQAFPPRIVMIHCKAPAKERKRSASALQEVMAQAVKNLPYLVPSNTVIPSNATNWDVPGSWSAARVTGKLDRVRYSGQKKGPAAVPRAALDLLIKLNRDPSTSKEVFVLLGQGFDLAEFKKNVKGNKPDPANIQVAYLVQSTWSHVRKIAGRFLIFCN